MKPKTDDEFYQRANISRNSDTKKVLEERNGKETLFNTWEDKWKIKPKQEIFMSKKKIERIIGSEHQAVKNKNRKSEWEEIAEILNATTSTNQGGRRRDTWKLRSKNIHHQEILHRVNYENNS